MLGALFQPDQITCLVEIPVIVGKFTLKHQEFLVLCVFMRGGRGAGLHSINMESDAQPVMRIYLQGTFMGRRAGVYTERLELVVMNVDDTTIGRLNFLHLYLCSACIDYSIERCDQLAAKPVELAIGITKAARRKRIVRCFEQHRKYRVRMIFADSSQNP